MNFIRKIGYAIYNPAFYKSIPSTSTGSALLYFLIVITIIVIITVSTMAIPLTQGVNTLLNDGTKQILNEYPDELQVTIKNGKVSTNVEEPYFIALPKSWESEDADAENLLVIDTRTPFSQEQFEQYDSLVWLTKDSLFIRGDTQTRANDLSEVKNFVLDKKKIEDIMAEVSPWFKFAAPLAVVALVFVLFIAKAFTLVYVFFLAFVLWILSKLFSLTVSYGDMYKIGLYAITLGLLVELIIHLTKSLVEIPTFPFMFTLIAIGVFSANILYHRGLWKVDEKTVQKTSSHPQNNP